LATSKLNARTTWFALVLLRQLSGARTTSSEHQICQAALNGDLQTMPGRSSSSLGLPAPIRAGVTGSSLTPAPLIVTRRRRLPRTLALPQDPHPVLRLRFPTPRQNRRPRLLLLPLGMRTSQMGASLVTMARSATTTAQNILRDSFILPEKPCPRRVDERMEVKGRGMDEDGGQNLCRWNRRMAMV